MTIEAGPRFLKAVKKLSEAERAGAEEALSRLQETWGRPHQHTGPASGSWAPDRTSCAWACTGGS